MSIVTTNLGKVVITPKGNWSSSVTYERLDLVTSVSGSSYISLSDNNINHALSDTDWWQVVANVDNAVQNANDAAIIANEKAGLANTAATNADNARLAIQDDLALKANHGYESNPKTLKEVDDGINQLAGDLNKLWVNHDLSEGDYRKVAQYVDDFRVINPDEGAVYSFQQISKTRRTIRKNGVYYVNDTRILSGDSSNWYSIPNYVGDEYFFIKFNPSNQPTDLTYSEPTGAIISSKCLIDEDDLAFDEMLRDSVLDIKYIDIEGIFLNTLIISLYL